MTRVDGHTALGTFVPFVHLCPGVEVCAIAYYIKRNEYKRRRRFMADFEAKTSESVLELGARGRTVEAVAAPSTPE